MKLYPVVIFLFSFFLNLLSANFSAAQTPDSIPKFPPTGHVRYTLTTDSIVREVFAIVAQKHIDQLPIGERIAAIGKIFLEKPYIEKSLEVGSDKDEVICSLQGFDCVTFFESIWALARLAKNPTLGTSYHFGLELAKTRYRDFEGFSSRLHYTCDYFYENAKRGLLKEMTKTIGGSEAKREKKTIDFMTKHPDLYPQLADDPVMVMKMDSIEKMINARGGYYYIPKEDVEDIEKGIMTGDLIGITTSFSGIDCSHTGIAIREKDGRIHFMHASSATQKVIISPVPLAEYLAGNKKQTGIMIYRPVDVK
jgi:hypothetical protein